MNTPARKIIAIIITIAWVSMQGVSASLENASNFTGELLKNHSYLLNSDELQSIDEINRSLREMQQKLNGDISDSEKNSIQQKAENVIDELNEIVSDMDYLIPLHIDKDYALIKQEKPITFPGDMGAMLFHVDNNNGEVSYQTMQLDYSNLNENIQLQLDVDTNTQSFILVTLTNAPNEMVTMPVLIKRQNNFTLYTYIQIQAPMFANLQVEVLSGDTGEPVPAMMRLVWKTNNVDRPTSNAIEIAHQMDSQGSPSGRRRAQLPGDLAGPYWCVPGPFSMEVPPGEWELTIRKGVEHLAIKDTFHVEEGETLSKTYRLRRWVDMREHGWYSGDGHVHCQILSDDDAERVMAWVQAEDIHLANIVKMGDVYRTWFEQRGFGTNFRVIEDDYVLSPGQECPRTHQELGHTIHMNTDSMVRDTEKYFLYDWMFNEVDKQGGLSGFCHVLFNMFEVHRGMTLLAPKTPIDFIEIMQFNQLGTELFYDFLNLGFKMTAGAGSDVPWGGTVGEVRMYAYLGDIPFSSDSWFDAVQRGRTFVTNGPMIDFRVNNALPGDEIKIGKDETVHVSAKVWGHPSRFTPSQLEIVSQGEVIKSVSANDTNNSELTLEFDIPAGNGCWLAARAKGSDGSQAHTTPVYVVHPPYRFWKLDDIDALLAKRYQSLKEVDELIQDYQSRMSGITKSSDYKIDTFNRQAPELQKRVDEAQRFYKNLETLAAKEKEMQQ